MRVKIFSTIEKYFFLIVTILNLIPVLSGKFFTTLDGAAHLYNSNLINILLFENNIDLQNFFVLNHEPVPNWTGHFILSFFNYFFPAFIAEKILVLLYLIGLPYSFRRLIKTISPDNYLLSYFIFPFSYSLFFFLGFYNFSIALIIFFITLNYWIKNEENHQSKKKIFILSSLIVFTYFSHVFVFVLLIFLLGFRILIKIFIELLQNVNKVKKIITGLLKRFSVLLISSLIPLILCCYYFISRPTFQYNEYVSNKELIESIINLRPIIALDFSKEVVFSKILFYVITSLFIIAVYNKIGLLKCQGDINFKTKILTVFRRIITVSDYWLFSAIFILFLYFTVPDYDGSAGFITLRLGLFFFLLLIIWLTTQQFSQWLSILAVVVVLYCNFKLDMYYSSSVKELNKIVAEVSKVSEYILPNSIVLPLNYSDNWLVKHFSNYLGADKPMIILENYECSKDYFPVKWNEKRIPNLLLGSEDYNTYPCIQWMANSNNPSKTIDYVFILGNIYIKSDTCCEAFEQNISNNYILIFKTDNCKLYRIKPISGLVDKS